MADNGHEDDLDFEQDLDDLKNDIVVTKYKQAAEIANAALQAVTKACVPGALVVNLCELGDSFIEERANKLYTKLKADPDQDPTLLLRGVSFPTCIGVNNVGGSFSPFKGDQTVLKEGDVVSIDLGAHIHGYVAQVAHTIVVPKLNGETVEHVPVTDARANAIAAAYTAADAAWRLLRPGQTNTAVTKIIEAVAKEYGVSAVAGAISNEVRCFSVDAGKSILNRADPEMKLEESTFAENEVWVIDIYMSTGEGKPRPDPTRSTVYKRDPENKYMLKLDSARWLYGQVQRKFASMPFTLRSLGDERKARMGVTECVKHDLLTSYPVLLEEEGKVFAHFKFTAMIVPTCTDRITPLALGKEINSSKTVEDKQVKQVLAMGTKRMSAAQKSKKKKAKQPAKTDAAAAAAAAAPTADKKMDTK